MTARDSRTPARIAFGVIVAALSYMVLYWAVPARALDVEVITDDHLADWVVHDDEAPCTGSTAETASALFVVGPAGEPRGLGSLQLAIGPNGNSRVWIENERFAGLNLEEITAIEGILKYAFVVQSPGNDLDGDRAPWLAFTIDRDDNGTEDDTLVYEPRRNTGVTTGVWREPNTKTSTSRWLSLTDREAETTNRGIQTLGQYRARFPLAEVVTLKIGAGPIEDHPDDGCGGTTGPPPEPPAWGGFSGNVDVAQVRMFTHHVIFDFEPEGTDSEPSSGSPIQTFTRTRTASPGATTGSPTASPSESTSSPGPTNTDGRRCPAEPGQNVVTGTDRDDTLRGTSGDDVICAFGGNDLVSGRGGDDEIRLGAGRDKGVGRGGRDDIFGARGRDVLKGGAGRDDLVGGPGRDRCVGGPGRDRFRSCEKRLR